ncbi:MAG: dTDP-4-dehydrorhamnose 3,5-epimerase [Blastomonas sp.]|uniref:dTDP-4-dehydrorhamnose 3,5-epimerase n=1 Tax=Blastomonas TaxID=150203 RepID=UPI0025827470|nr:MULTISPECIES: dTDP-4-dehydrorhamnose 3,5-epimerase [Blastomonas]MCO5791486.1 dTDP-4-dehydrorhamnose 3,5-epimerase [Blastomonas sp.]MDM7966160.1 dTDP-4-dehydrorhamnose 3,5-epimerase [Blastomonas fulva]
MIISPVDIPGPLVIEPKVFGDERGFFLESWNEARFKDAGLDLAFVQDNHSRSAKGVLRGVHFQNPNPQGKLVRVVSGAVWDVAVDLRASSPYFGKWFGIELSAANKRMFWVPPGFGHGFLTLEDGTDFLYKCTSLYEPASEQSLQWDDPAVGIDWPLGDIVPQLSQKDREGTAFDQIKAYS